MLRFFTNDLRRNITKIICLTAGLAVGFLLVAKVYFEQTYDTCFPDYDRLYIVTESVTQNGEYKEYKQTAGAIAPGLKRYCPQVESATRKTSFLGSCTIRLDDGRTFETDGITLADSCFFSVFPAERIAGDLHMALETESTCVIPRSLADKIGGDVIGLQFCVPDFTEKYKATIGGVYEDFPLNNSIGNTIYLSLPSIGLFSYDGRDNWIGNDRYASFVRLAKGTGAADLRPGIQKMLEENVDDEELNIFHFNIGVEKLVGLHTAQSDIQTTIWVMSMLALIRLMSAGLNYLLIVIGQMGKRGKEMAVRKCYGTSNVRIFGRVMGESLFFLLLSIGLAVLTVLCLSEQCRQLLGYTPQQLLTTGNVWLVEGAVCVGLLIVTGAIPAWAYCRMPVANAFRSGTRSHKAWKLALLAVQFFASGLLMCMLVLAGRQYAMLGNTDMGFEYKNVGYVNLSGVPDETRHTIVSELRRLGNVESVASAYQNFTQYASGNNVWVGDDIASQVNVADLYYANADIVEALGMKLLRGETFREDADTSVHQAIVEERFIELLQTHFGVKDRNIIGRRFKITEHLGLDGAEEFTICGVIGNMRRNGFVSDMADMRAGVLFPTDIINNNLYVRFSRLTPEALRKAQETIDTASPVRQLYITPYRTHIDRLTEPVRRFRSSIMVIGISIIVIALIGLTGYVTDEVQRRAKEIAIRKVTGTSASMIVRLFCLDILKVALPSLLAGGAAAMIIGRKWLSQFTVQTSLSPLSLALCLLLLLVIILAVVAANSLRVARSNPVEHLRDE